MATSTYLQNPSVIINSVDVSDQCTSATFTRVIEQLEKTAFGSTNRSYTSGLENSTLTVTLYQSFAASETYATLAALVGTSVTVSVAPATGAQSSTNPKFTLTGAYLESLPLVAGSYGQLSTIDITFVGGAYSVAVV